MQPLLRVHRAVVVLLASIAGFGAAHAEPLRTPRQLIDRLGPEIRQILADPKSGKSPEDAERAAAEQITALIRSSEGHLLLTERDVKGNTPLMLAASDAYALIVAALLADPSVKLAINASNADGETAWMMASFAPSLTLAACQPGALTRERYALLPPYLLRMGHLLKTRGAAIGHILQALEAAGAEAQPEAGRQAWLKRCPNSSPELREALTATGEGRLMPTLLNHAIARQGEFNRTALKSVEGIPAAPPKGMRFIPDADGKKRRPSSPLLQIHDVHCQHMAKPQLPNRIFWQGEIVMKVVAATRAGVIEAADFDLVSFQGDRKSDATDFMRGMILQALAGYRCEGEHVFEQEFHLKIE